MVATLHHVWLPESNQNSQAQSTSQRHDHHMFARKTSPSTICIMVGGWSKNGDFARGKIRNLTYSYWKYWKWLFIVDLPIDSMVIFHSYVNVYQRVGMRFKDKSRYGYWSKEHSNLDDVMPTIVWSGDVAYDSSRFLERRWGCLMFEGVSFLYRNPWIRFEYQNHMSKLIINIQVTSIITFSMENLPVISGAFSHEKNVLFDTRFPIATGGSQRHFGRVVRWDPTEDPQHPGCRRPLGSMDFMERFRSSMGNAREIESHPWKKKPQFVELQVMKRSTQTKFSLVSLGKEFVPGKSMLIQSATAACGSSHES